MSFFKSMFRGKKESAKPTTPSKRPEARTPQPPRSAEPANKPVPAADPAPDLGGSMFAGLNVKSKEPKTQQPTSPQPATQSSGGLDMFSGMVLKTESKDEPEEDDDGPSLLNMLNGDDDDADDAEQDRSGFSFMEEPSLDEADGAGVGADTTPQHAQAAQKINASAFDFLMGTPSQDVEMSLDMGTDTNQQDPHPSGDADAETPSMFDLSGLTLKTGSPGETIGDEEPEEGTVPLEDPEPEPEPEPVQRPATRRWGKPRKESVSVQQAMQSATPTKPPTAKQSKQSSSGDTWESIRGRLTDAMVNYWTTLRDIRAQQSSLRQREISNQNTFLQAQKSLEDLDAQQSEAIEKEEYEKAEQINDEIEQTRKRMKAMRIAIDQATRKAASLHEQETSQTNSLLTEVEKSIEAMHTYQKKQEVELNKFVRTESLKLEDKEDRLNMETNRIERLLNHLNTDLAHVVEEEAEIEKSIAEETSEVEKEKDELMLKEHSISQEVEELRRQLAAKEEELAQCQEQLHAAESQIEKSRAKYKRTLDVVQQKRQQIVSEKMDTVHEQEKFEAERQELEAEREAINKRKEAFNKIVDTIRLEQKRSDALADRLKAQKPLEQSQSEDGDERKVVAQLMRDLKLKSDAVEARSRDLIEVETKLADEQRNVQAAERSVPELQSQKKLAVKSKNFKKAGTISKQIKELEASKATSLENMKSIEQSVKQISQEIQALTDEKQNLQLQLSNAERDSDIKRIKVVLKRRAKIQVDLARCNRELAEESNNPALEAERETLEADISYCEAEATEIRAKHQWSDDFPEVEVEDVAPEPEPEPEPEAEPEADPEDEQKAVDPSAVLQKQLCEAEQELQQAESGLSEWEDELEAALEEEDFDKCDSLNDKIEKRKGELEQLQARVGDLKAQLAELQASQQPPAVLEEEEEEEEKETIVEGESEPEPEPEAEPAPAPDEADLEHSAEETTPGPEVEADTTNDVPETDATPFVEAKDDAEVEAEAETDAVTNSADHPDTAEDEPSSFDFLQDDDGDDDGDDDAQEAHVSDVSGDADADDADASGFDFVNE